ncbi:MAG: serine/threonine-protein kinase [Candidatus Polarisedimenticolia bacterium]|nr:serine/threonine protein kinase [bacterium]
MTVAAGEEILGYRVEGLIGEGGMGAVYKAVHPVFGQEVAIKVLDPLLARNVELRERFVQEARIQMGLRHQGIVQVLTGEVKGERAALVMEFVDGLSLEEVIRRRGTLPAAEAAAIFVQVLAAVGHAHERGVVHRDLKPANVMVTADGTAKVTDFGIARVVGNLRLTRTGTTMGSPHYMAPEQILGSKEIDHRADIYALGAALFEALSGRPPFAEFERAGADSDFAVKEAHVRRDPPDLCALRPDVPPAIAEAVRIALAKDPEARFQSCWEFAAALEQAAQDHAATAGELLDQEDAFAAEEAALAEVDSRESEEAIQRDLVTDRIFVVALVLLVVLAVIVILAGSL